MKNQENTKETKRSNTDLQDAREFAEMYGQLSPNERLRVKSIMVGIKIAKEAPQEVAVE